MQNAVHIYKGNIVGASSGGGGSSDDLFVITVTWSDAGLKWVADKLPSEVDAAFAADKRIVVEFEEPENNWTLRLELIKYIQYEFYTIYEFGMLQLNRQGVELPFADEVNLRFMPAGSTDEWYQITGGLDRMEIPKYREWLDTRNPLYAISATGASYPTLYGLKMGLYRCSSYSGFISELPESTIGWGWLLVTKDDDSSGALHKYILHSSTTGKLYFGEQSSSSGTATWHEVGGSGGPAVFTITLSGTGEQGDPYVVDKTPAEVAEAYEAGKVLVMERDDSGGEKLQLIQGYTDPSVSFAFGMTVVMPRFGEPIIVSHVAMLNSNDGVDWDSINVVPTEFTYCQLSTMITTGWNGEDVGKVFQYVGTTDANYTKGYFYRLNRDTTTMPSTYFWEQINVQPSFIDSGTTDLTPGTSPLSTGSLYVVYE